MTKQHVFEFCKHSEELRLEKTRFQHRKKELNGINLILIDLPKTYELMVNDLKSKGGLIYAKKI